MKTVLFSPVGGTDPISQNNCRDGSLLHICRVYKPDKVYLYMSKEILEKQKKDSRYTACLDMLCELQKRTMEYVIIERPNLDKVYEFDFFYKDFKEIVDHIIDEEIEEDDSLILNISSGTPAMKSGLAVLQTITEFPCTLIQVTTPVRKMNEHNHAGFDFQEMWELNEDNEEGFENRCHEISCPTLSEIKKEEIIKRHLQAYDYSAALHVADTLSEARTKNYYHLLEMAYYRLLLNIKMVVKKSTGVPDDLFPVKSGDGRILFEYALQLRVQLLRDEYADFIRGITPIIVDLFELVLKTYCATDIKDFTYIDKKTDKMTGKVKEIRRWDKNKLNGTDIMNTFQDYYYPNVFDARTIKSDNLVALLVKYSEDDALKKIVRDIRSVEENIRNIAAHNIVSVDDDVIYRMTGFRASQIMNMIQKLFNYTNIKVSGKAWESYERMNDYIISKI